MIDKVKMSTIVSIPNDLLENERWHSGISKHTGNPYYTHLFHGLTILYYPHSHRLIIDGRLVTASIQPDAVTNLDALQAGITEARVTQQHHSSEEGSRVSYSLAAHSQNLTEFLVWINQYLSDLVGSSIDILYFHVTKIEICFNVYVENVEQYIKIFNLIHARTDPSSYVNFALVKNKPLYSSYYVKTRSDFRSNVRRGIIVNFYNKKDQLKNRHKDSLLEADSVYTSDNNNKRKGLRGQVISRRSKRILSEVDDRVGLEAAKLAEKNLRMEVQLHYKALFDLLGKGDRHFGLFLDIDYCREIVARQYAKKLISSYDRYLEFCSLKIMSDAINHTDWSNTVQRNLLHSIIEIAQNHSLSQSQFYNHRRRMDDLGMHWFPIPARFHVDRLISPIRLLDEQIVKVKHDSTTYNSRQQISHLEVDMYSSIEEEDVSLVIVEPRRDL